jgi:uncharacterized membrane protein HdeD (DUF308 family)
MLAKLFARSWWILLLRGILAILFGIVAFAVPGITLLALVTYFAAWLVIDGAFDIIHALQGRSGNKSWWMMLLEGVLEIAIGVLAFRAPGGATLVILFWISLWAIVGGVTRVALAIRLREEIQGEGWLALSGLISIVFGFLILSQPAEGALAVIWMIGAWALVVGVTLVLFAFKVRGMAKRIEDVTGKVKAAIQS